MAVNKEGMVQGPGTKDVDTFWPYIENQFSNIGNWLTDNWLAVSIFLLIILVFCLFLYMQRRRINNQEDELKKKFGVIFDLNADIKQNEKNNEAMKDRFRQERSAFHERINDLSEQLESAYKELEELRDKEKRQRLLIYEESQRANQTIEDKLNSFCSQMLREKKPQILLSLPSLLQVINDIIGENGQRLTVEGESKTIVDLIEAIIIFCPDYQDGEYRVQVSVSGYGKSIAVMPVDKSFDDSKSKVDEDKFLRSVFGDLVSSDSDISEVISEHEQIQEAKKRGY